MVSRRLFSSSVDEGRRDEVCRAFFEMYRQNPNEFPVETRDPAYLERMKNPATPSIPKCTTGCMTTGRRSMGSSARAVSCVSWPRSFMTCGRKGMRGRSSWSARFPYVSPVRDELTRYLPEQWGPVIDTEVDGKNSEPVKADLANPRYNKVFATRRVARAIFMGSAPDAEGQSARGVELAGIKLGVVRPGDKSPFSRTL